jgi:transcription factor SFP1
MAGTSPFPYQSPSYHSSSYLPKLEANFMRDFSCCGKTLPTLHDLLQHYEECHAQQTPQSLRTASATQQSRDTQPPNSKAAIATQAATSVQQQAQAQQQRQQQQQQQAGRPQSSGVKMGQPATGTTSSLTGGIQLMRQQQQAQPVTPTQRTVQPVDVEMDEVEDMEMDDGIDTLDQVPDATALSMQRSAQQAQQSLFGQQPRPTLNMSGTGLIHQGLRTSQPTTPATSAFTFQNNPTVSSVNTPTLSTQSVQQQGQTFSPDSSIPGTPAEPDDEYGNMAANMNYGNLNMNMGSMNFGYGYGSDLGLDLCIDEPAKRLYSPGSGFGSQRALQQQFASFGLGNGQFAGNDDLMRRFRQQQQLMMMQNQGMGNGTTAAMMMNGEENKPFRCPVIGCEKAYKNQNGLK